MKRNLLRNTRESYSLIFICIHWLMAFAVFILFILGLWMVELDYYSDLYRIAPDFHRSLGVILGLLLVIRFFYKLISPLPCNGIEKGLKGFLVIFVHNALYFLILLIAISGYLISTADGRSINVFGVISIPATITFIERQEQLAGKVHLYSAYVLISLVCLHAFAALKHHFIDRDNTLKKMLGIK